VGAGFERISEETIYSEFSIQKLRTGPEERHEIPQISCLRSEIQILDQTNTK
jgi:hypothetical protein